MNVKNLQLAQIRKVRVEWSVEEVFGELEITKAGDLSDRIEAVISETIR